MSVVKGGITDLMHCRVRRERPGDVVAVEEHPHDPSKVIIVINRGTTLTPRVVVARIHPWAMCALEHQGKVCGEKISL